MAKKPAKAPAAIAKQKFGDIFRPAQKGKTKVEAAGSDRKIPPQVVKERMKITLANIIAKKGRN